jgi:acyl-CoA reductase-like NAD-dependent aldehyde dehydrogenase
MKISNPATHEVIKELKDDDVKSIEAKYQRARTAQSNWAKLTLADRIEVLQRFHDLLDQNKDHLAKTLTLEVGKPLQEALNEVNGAKTRIKFFIQNAQKWLGPQELNKDGNTTDVLAFDPLGVICNISAWNYPFLVGVNVFVPALIAGNAVLYKPSEYATMTGLEIEKLLHEAGTPKDAFIAVIGSAPAGEALLNLPCDGYFFTGSYKTGKYIAEKVASKLVPVGLELGGKDPLYVTDKLTDLSKTAGAVAEGCFYNNGQSCCAVERVYVHETVYDSFMEKFLAEVKNLKVGNPLDKENQQGAVTREGHLNFLDEQVKDAVKKGATLVSGGKRTGTANFYQPTVLVNVDHNMSLMKDETFGPVIGIMKVKDDAEAIKLMNDTEYGLTASVYCEDIERAKQILGQVDAGTSYINCCDRVSPYLPWSGRKNSGLGATLSYLGILTFAKSRGWHIRT